MAELEPDIAGQAPWSEAPTDHDLGHLAAYMRLLDADLEAPTGARPPA